MENILIAILIVCLFLLARIQITQEDKKMNQAIQNLTDAITKLNTTVAGALPLLTNPTVVTQIQAAADAVNTASQTLSNAINPAS